MPSNAAGSAAGDERHALERARRIACASSASTSFDVKPDELRADRLIARRAAPSRCPGVTSMLVRARRFRAARDDQQRRQAAAAGTPGRARRAARRRRRRPPSVTTWRRTACALDRPWPWSMRAALLDRLLDEPLDQPRRVTASSPPSRDVAFDRAQDRGLERRIVFLEVQRDLGVGDAPAQRPTSRTQTSAAKTASASDAERDDGGGR